MFSGLAVKPGDHFGIAALDVRLGECVFAPYFGLGFRAIGFGFAGRADCRWIDRWRGLLLCHQLHGLGGHGGDEVFLLGIERHARRSLKTHGLLHLNLIRQRHMLGLVRHGGRLDSLERFRVQGHPPLTMHDQVSLVVLILERAHGLTKQDRHVLFDRPGVLGLLIADQ